VNSQAATGKAAIGKSLPCGAMGAGGGTASPVSCGPEAALRQQQQQQKLRPAPAPSPIASRTSW